MPDKIDIRPGVNILSLLRHLNYRPWYALGEFVDNSVQSFNSHRAALKALHGDEAKLCVEIDINPKDNSICIRDNAAGISEAEYGRAFRPAALPTDTSGLSEFGMGMKSAACWFTHRWKVRTSALGEPVARTVAFDIENIVSDDISELGIHEEEAPEDEHYTEITLEDVFHFPKGNTIKKLKDHMADIYRVFIRSGDLELRLSGEIQKYAEPKVLQAPYFEDLSSEAKTWRKEITFDFGGGLSAHGFAALLEKGSTRKAGFALFRRDRVIQGSGDEGYRPAAIFKSSNSYTYQRLFGELHLEGFEVSHTKDGFRWDDNEEAFLDLLSEHLDGGDLPLLKQAEGHRVRAAEVDLQKPAQEAVDKTVEALQDKLHEVADEIATRPGDESDDSTFPEQAALASGAPFGFRFRGRPWQVNVELANDPEESRWLTISQEPEDTAQEMRQLGIRVSLAHPFMVRFAQADRESIEALLRVAAAIALATVLARASGATGAGAVRNNLNDILRAALSGP